MARNALIIDAGLALRNSHGKLNHHFADVVSEELSALGYSVTVTRLEEGWEAAKENERMREADVVVAQFPVWWMSAPWQFKKYVDEVFGAGMITGDGRTRTAPDINYGTGGLLKSRFMLSCTWNAPAYAFTAPDEFFEGKGIDAVLFPLRKAFEFLGMKPLPTFMANDVMKNPKIEQDEARLREHVRRVFADL
ncbi:MAG: NAD(P)H-dependent oxidoreductase [Duodenibacillus sp.]|nr:NAD(P)H-dependent oxidoreductase [Duodenibacillus sp.]